MAREDHQPWSEPDRRKLTAEELHDAFGRTVAFVLALGPSGEDDAQGIAHAIAEAWRARVAAVFVLARAGQATVASKAVGESASAETATVLLESDPSDAIAITREAGDFELIGIPFGTLAAMRDAATEICPDYDAALVIDARQQRISAEHLFELHEDAREHGEAEIVVSWIQWLRRMPVLIKRKFLDRLESVARRPLRSLPMRDHVFGEERLAEPVRPCGAASAFLEGCTMSALQAVGLARYAEAHPDEELHSPNQPRTLLQTADPEPLSEADALLVEAAGKVASEGSLVGGDEEAELAWADEFGRRNSLDFPILNDRAHEGRLSYLDSAATSQRVMAALQAQRDFDVHENANVYRGAYGLSAQATFTLNDARKVLEDFIGAERREVIFTTNTSAATGLVALAWGERNIGEDDAIVCSLADHHSNTLPFMMLAERKGARLLNVPFDEGGRLDREAFRAALAQRPKLVCLAHIGNVFGIEAPVKELTAEAHDAGARVLLDAAQSFPHVPIDVRELGVDWLACSAHKAYGPMGIGALWASPEAFDEMDPLVGGGGTVSHVSADTYYLRPKALQHEPGTPPVSQAVGWAAAIGYLESLGMENVARHSAALTRYAVRGLERLDGVNVVGDHSRPDGQNGLVSFTVRSVAPADLAAFLGRLDVAIRAGGHCALPLHCALGLIGTGRISIGVHTTKSDIDAALAAIDLCRRAYEGEI